jgi:hypothetical protein
MDGDFRPELVAGLGQNLQAYRFLGETFELIMMDRMRTIIEIKKLYENDIIGEPVRVPDRCFAMLHTGRQQEGFILPQRPGLREF